MPHVTLILRWRSWVTCVEYEWWDSLVDPASDNIVVGPAWSSPPFGMESKARLLYVGSSVVDGNRLNDGRVLLSPPSDSEEVDGARISTTEEEGRRCTMGGSEVGMTESSALLR